MARGDYPSSKQDQFVLRLPDGLRDRIKNHAERNGRSMNAEIVQALEQFFPPEPSVEEVLERVHAAISMASGAHSMPYRKVLVDALDDLSNRLSSGIEFDQFQSRTLPEHAKGLDGIMARMGRWRRAEKYGVEQADLERELTKGLVRMGGRTLVHSAISAFKKGKPELALGLLHLDRVKFAEPDAAHKAIEADLRAYYEANWGDPDQDYIPEDF